MNKAISVSEVPSYLKNSEVYKTLVENDVKYVIGTLPVYRFTSNKMTFNKFEELLRTLYFWKVSTMDYPIEFFLYISENLYKIKDYFSRFKNSFTDDFIYKHMTNSNFILETNFLVSVICLENNMTLLNYMIQNNVMSVGELFAKICGYENLKIINHMLKTYDLKSLNMYDALFYATENNLVNVAKILFKTKAIKINDPRVDYALKTACTINRINIAKFLLEKGANVHADNNLALYNACERSNVKIVELLLDYGANIHDMNDNIFLIAAKAENNNIINLLLDKSIENKTPYSEKVLSHAKMKTKRKAIHNTINNYIATK